MPDLDADRFELYTGAAPTAQDELLYEYAIAFLEGETTRYFGAHEEVTEYLRGSGSSRLWLKEPPVSGDGIDAPTLDTRNVGADWDAVDADAWEVRGRVLVRTDGAQWLRTHEYRATYTRGYEVLPTDVEQAAFDLIRWKVEDLGTDPRLKSERIGDYQYTLADVSESPWAAKVNRVIMRWKDNPA